MRRYAQRRADRGFTLVEAVIVIAVTAIVGGIIALFIRIPVMSYVDSAARAQLTDVADFALRRMARDIRLALPNSVRTGAAGNVQFLELWPSKAGGRYEDGVADPAADSLSFEDPADLSFALRGPVPAGNQAITPNDYIVVYNLGPGMAPADVYASGLDCANCNRARVAGIDAAGIVTLHTNSFGAQTPPLGSPDQRFQVAAPGPVTYVCNEDDRTLRRYWNYPVRPDLPASAADAAASATGALLATGVVECEFDAVNLANVRSGLVSLSLTLAGATPDAGSVRLFQQIHVDNTP